MDMKELRQHTLKRLQELAAVQASTIRDLRFTVGTRQSTHVRNLRKAKKDFARIQAAIAEKARSEFQTKPN
ncbi:hypothetical protein KJZ71_03075 [Patescibacteria group bacterium]|uniref:50S ribosomal protein L29 n=1 Tax=candidate division WWE3 bacterium TaxID=2053526 RepID=A0A928TRP0_UNCKA|nr:hypothetical protein [candidate division WWE3 bacterium]MCL4732761.1 hypothetical protein [Patescibacteria group bacterium]MDL1952921.1 hypothetical protein [Candidatus Uhrbacteria bacterium UHB]RIL00641.1 MAG: hypothetical protein DCC77_03770 [Candidatus Uhrbacteria bacterium]